MVHILWTLQTISPPLLGSVWQLSVQIFVASQNQKWAKQEVYRCHRNHLHAVSSTEAARKRKDSSSPRCHTAICGVKYSYWWRLCSNSKLGDNVLHWSFGKVFLTIVSRAACGISSGSEHWKCEEHLSVHIMPAALFVWLTLSFVETVVLYKLMEYLAIRLAEFCRNNYQIWHYPLELSIKSLLVRFTVGTNISRLVCNNETSTVLQRDLLHLIISLFNPKPNLKLHISGWRVQPSLQLTSETLTLKVPGSKPYLGKWLNMNSWRGAGQKPTNATLGDSKKGEWVGMGGDFMFWYDASEISVEVLFPLAGYTFKKDLKVLEREQSTKKS